MDFFDNVVNKSNAIIKERLNNPFGQKQGSQSQEQTAEQQQQQDIQAKENVVAVQHQASTSSANNSKIEPSSDQQADDAIADGQDKNSQFAAIAADAEAVAQKAAKGAQKFGTFLFSMANKAGQTMTQTAKQVKQAVESTSILTDFTREQQEFIKEHGGSMQAGELPWFSPSGDEQKSNYIREQILSLSQDKRNFVRSPPKNTDYKFEAQKFYPIALSLLKEDPNLSKMRYELVPKLVSEDTFWCNYFYRVEMLKKEGDSKGQATSWASSRSSSGEGPDEVTSVSCNQPTLDEPPSPSYESAASQKSTTTTTQQSYNLDSSLRMNAEIASSGEETTSNNNVSRQQATNIDDTDDVSGSDPSRVVAEADDLKSRLRELNIGSFDGSQDAAKDAEDDEWDEELQREFELVSGDLDELDDDELNNDLLELERSIKECKKGKLNDSEEKRISK